MRPTITYDEALIEEIAARFDLRDPNKRALTALIERLAEGEGDFQELVADLATGVGKTFLMSSLVEYVAAQGVRHVLVVTPGSTIQTKTLANFDQASAKYVAGAEIAPFVVTPDNFQAANVGAALRNSNQLKVFVFNVQQLIRPTDKVSRRTREADENLGDALYAYLTDSDDLLVIADEHHVYREKAKAFSAAIRDLAPLALVGLTATPDKEDLGKVVFQYTLGEAIADGHVKVPVIVYRQDGTKDERTQLRDACQLLGHKEEAYRVYREVNPDAAAVKPCLFVVCQSIEHASEVGQILAQPGFVGDGSKVLEITSQSSDEALDALAHVEDPESPIWAIVSVNMLREGWDVKNIAVIVALRRLASQTLTEQILGRGLRLPFGARTGVADVDQVDLVAHDSYQQLLAQKDVLAQRIALPANAIEVDETGAATTATIDPTQPTTGESTLGVDSIEVRQAPGTTTSGETLGQNPPAPGEESDHQRNQNTGTTPAEVGLDRAPEGEPGEEGSSFDPSQPFELLIAETDDRLTAQAPTTAMRVQDAPQIVFPRREARLRPASFQLSEVADGDARRAGARFIQEVPTFLFRDALEAERVGDEVTITAPVQKRETARQELVGLDIVETELANAILLQPEVPQERASKNAARRLVKAFLDGAGVRDTSETAEWGQKRREQAVEGMRRMIRAHIDTKRMEQHYVFEDIVLPLEPVIVPSGVLDAYNEQRHTKGKTYQGWQRNIMPIASFDAGTTEWELAKLMDRDDDIQWWVRLYVGGLAFIPMTSGKYYPDFIALDKAGTYWLIEAKGDKYARDIDVIAKREAAEQWARAVRDDGQRGNWRYLFATETNIRQAAGSWVNLVAAADPE